MIEVNIILQLKCWKCEPILNDLHVIIVNYMQNNVIVCFIFMVLMLIPIGAVHVNFDCSMELQIIELYTGFLEIRTTVRRIVLSRVFYDDWGTVD